MTNLGETQVEQLLKRATALGGQPCCHQKSVGAETSGSPKGETRLLCRLCVELAKGQRDT